ncbi:hypothetical protein WIV_gp160 [Wiseana iridescent virus]|uniref:RING-type domain-containing protein n=1 Tax=Wiseana iridescent virus TaxID=68347 RepID=G0T5I6_IRV9|nr:hypothetical protein WIV_gp160 [Wiseana iridescent virus]ADO00504.1 hypothetical protein [Wiseana iridescent virus]
MDSLSLLDRRNASQLRQFSVYLSEFQQCKFITPESTRQKKYWLLTAHQMLMEKNPQNPNEYINKIFSIIRWFTTNKIKICQNMQSRNTTTAFTIKIINDFVRNVTDTVIYLENRSRDHIEINKTDMIITNTRILQQFTNFPNTMNRLNFYPSPSNGDDFHTPSKPLFKPIKISDEEVTEETRGLECKVCTINKICIVLVGCGHTFCNECTTRFENKCATCRTPFTSSNKIRMYI